jgi:hypothetical protein
MNTVQFPHDNPPYHDFRARHHHAHLKRLLNLDPRHHLLLLVLSFKDGIRQYFFLSRKNRLRP